MYHLAIALESGKVVLFDVLLLSVLTYVSDVDDSHYTVFNDDGIVQSFCIQ